MCVPQGSIVGQLDYRALDHAGGHLRFPTRRVLLNKYAEYLHAINLDLICDTKV